MKIPRAVKRQFLRRHCRPQGEAIHVSFRIKCEMTRRYFATNLSGDVLNHERHEKTRKLRPEREFSCLFVFFVVV
jgi:hypothetical protein